MGIFYLVVAAILVLDQGSKFLVQQQMHLFQSIKLIPGLLSFTYILNPGAAFGILRYQTTFLIALTILVVFAMIYYRKIIPLQPLIFRLALAIGLGGALGNLVDRLRIGAVVDFIELPHWPVFNIADMAILFGVVMIIATTLLSEIKNKKAKLKQEDAE